MVNAKLDIEELASTRHNLQDLEEKKREINSSTQKSTGEDKQLNKRDRKAKMGAKMVSGKCEELTHKPHRVQQVAHIKADFPSLNQPIAVNGIQ